MLATSTPFQLPPPPPVVPAGLVPISISSGLPSRPCSDLDREAPQAPPRSNPVDTPELLRPAAHQIDARPRIGVASHSLPAESANAAALPQMPSGFAPAVVPGTTPELLRVGMLQPETRRLTPQLLPGSSGLTSGGLLLQRDPSAPDLGPATGQPVSWSSLADDEDEDDDDEKLAPRSPAASAAKYSVSPARPCVVHEAEACEGWQEVLPRCGPRHSTPPASAVAPRPLPAWLHGRCCRCLVQGHRAADCRDLFRCSRCLENGHRARGCRNPWRPLSLLASLATSPLTCLAAEHRQAPAPRQAQIEAPLLRKTFRRDDSWASIVSAPVAPVGCGHGRCAAAVRLGGPGRAFAL